MIRLAGDIGPELIDPTPSRYVIEADVIPLAEHLAELSPRHRELIADHAASDSPAEWFSDDAVAAERSGRFAGQDEAFWHLGWLRVVARRLVYSNVAAIRALAAALLVHESLPAKAAIDLIENAIPRGPAMTRPKINPRIHYLCVDSHTSAFGVYQEGDRLIGSHAAVKAHPNLWVVEPSDPADVPAVLHAARIALLVSTTPDDPGPEAA